MLIKFFKTIEEGIEYLGKIGMTYEEINDLLDNDKMDFLTFCNVLKSSEEMSNQNSEYYER